MDLPWKSHFGVTCACGKACVVNVTPEQIALDDPTRILRSLSTDDQQAIAAFYVEHKKLGHKPEADLVGIAPMPQS